MRKKRKIEAVRLSASFYKVATMSKGDDLWPWIQLESGRGGANIQRATVERWAKMGLVVIAYGKGAHHLSRPISTVKLTPMGAKRVDERTQREAARERKLEATAA